MKYRKWLKTGLAVTVLAGGSWMAVERLWPLRAWNEQELALLDSLTIRALGDPLPSRSNAVSDDPRAIELGRALFRDPALSINGRIACATCHDPGRHFTDGMPRGRALGHTKRNTMTIVGSAWSPWQYWDGRRDSLWSQALTPLEDPREQGSNRLHVVRTVLANEDYRRQWRALFGSVPDLQDETRFPAHASPLGRGAWREDWSGMSEADRRLVNRAFARVGKVLAAWERTLRPPRTRFDDYVAALRAGDGSDADAIFSRREQLGLRLFIGKARCIDCHNGPLFTNNEFHNTGILSAPGELPDRGRIEGLQEVLADPFNCLGEFSDAGAGGCPELRHVRSGIELLGAFRTPGLRNLDQTAPYMHKGQLETLEAVIEHYNEAPLAMIGHNEAEEPLGLSGFERRALEAFLLTLSDRSTEGDGE